MLVRAAFALGGLGSRFAVDEELLRELAQKAFNIVCYRGYYCGPRLLKISAFNLDCVWKVVVSIVIRLISSTFFGSRWNSIIILYVLIKLIIIRTSICIIIQTNLYCHMD